MSRQSSEELILLECFPVPEAGVFSVFVYEVEHNGMVGHKIMRLSDIDITTQSNVNKISAHTGNNGMITVMLYVLNQHHYN